VDENGSGGDEVKTSYTAPSSDWYGLVVWCNNNSSGSYKIEIEDNDVQDLQVSEDVPREFRLYQNYPNPFNAETRIRFSLPRSAFVTIEVYNTLGQRVRTLVGEQLSAGYKEVTWDGKDEGGQGVSSGVYFYRIKTGDFTESKRMILVK
jgi:hypothetical protein